MFRVGTRPYNQMLKASRERHLTYSLVPTDMQVQRLKRPLGETRSRVNSTKNVKYSLKTKLE